MLGLREAEIWKRGIAVPFKENGGASASASASGGGGCGVYWRNACPFCASRIDYVQPLFTA